MASSIVRNVSEPASIPPEILKAVVSRLNPADFRTFAAEYFLEMYGSRFEAFANHGLPMYKRKLLNLALGEDAYDTFEGIYIIDYLPLDLLKDLEHVDITTSPLTTALQYLVDHYKHRKPFFDYTRFVSVLRAIYFLNNLTVHHTEADKKIYIQYQSLVRRLGLPIFPWEWDSVQIGNISFWADKKPIQVEHLLKKLFTADDDGLALLLSTEGIKVRKFKTEKYLTSGVMPATHEGYGPVYTMAHRDNLDILQEFEKLINEDPSEARLEEFLRAHYREIFGSQYDRMETQLWLRFPDVDVSSKPRRLDIFLRNAVTNDWELFEIKKMIKLAGSYRDVPDFSREIHGAIQQIRNYSRILADDRVKKYFAAKGIEYYEPVLHLVVGKTPEIPHQQWRWLSEQTRDVKILTYDRLLAEMRARLQDRLTIMTSVPEEKC